MAKIKYDLTINTTTNYLEILTSQELLSAVKQQISMTELRLQHIKKEVDAGKRSLADLAQTKSLLATTKANKVNIESQLAISTLNMKLLLNMLHSNSIILKPPLKIVSVVNFSVDTTSDISNALNITPDIQLARLKRNAAKQATKIARGAVFPTLSLFSAIGSNYSNARSLAVGSQAAGFDTIGRVSNTNLPVLAPAFRNLYIPYSLSRQFADNFYQSVGLTLQVPIFNKLMARTNIKKAKIALQEAQFLTQIAETNFERIVKGAMIDVEAAKKLKAIAEANLDATFQVLNVSEKRFQAGLMNVIDYNIAVTNRNQAEFDLIQANYNLFFKTALINFYFGKQS